MSRLSSILTVASVLCVASAQAQYFDFSSPVTTGPTNASGVWYTDRYAPAGFQTSGGELIQSIRAGDAQATGFYNTQGRKYNLDANVTSMSIDLFVDASWATTGRRMAGFWGTAVNGSNAVASYPIIEFSSNSDVDGSGARFRVWNSQAPGSWSTLGAVTNFDQWYQLNISLDTTLDLITYQVGSLTMQVGALGATRLDNTILQGHNTANGVNYDIRWDNFSAPGMTPVPEPITMSLMLGGAALAIRRKIKAKKA